MGENYKKKLDLEEYLYDGGIIRPVNLRTSLFQPIGALIRRHQSRRDVGYSITTMASEPPPSALIPIKIVNPFPDTAKPVAS